MWPHDNDQLREYFIRYNAIPSWVIGIGSHVAEIYHNLNFIKSAMEYQIISHLQNAYNPWKLFRMKNTTIYYVRY